MATAVATLNTHRRARRCSAASGLSEVDHNCNPGCDGDKHFYVHGEKGHVCDPNCPVMRSMHMQGTDAEGEKKEG